MSSVHEIISMTGDRSVELRRYLLKAGAMAAVTVIASVYGAGALAMVHAKAPDLYSKQPCQGDPIVTGISGGNPERLSLFNPVCPM